MQGGNAVFGGKGHTEQRQNRELRDNNNESKNTQKKKKIQKKPTTKQNGKQIKILNSSKYLLNLKAA